MYVCVCVHAAFVARGHIEPVIFWMMDMMRDLGIAGDYVAIYIYTGTRD